MSGPGLLVADEGSSIDKNKLIYDSRKQKLTVDLKADPKHMDLFEMNGGTRYTLTKGASQSSEETLFQIKHNMPFPPMVLCYFYTIDAPVNAGGDGLDWSKTIGNYTLNRAHMVYNAVSIGQEGLYTFVDENNFYIKHFAETNSSGSGSFNFYGNLYRFRVRYLITNQRALDLGSKFGTFVT